MHGQLIRSTLEKEDNLLQEENGSEKRCAHLVTHCRSEALCRVGVLIFLLFAYTSHLFSDFLGAVVDVDGYSRTSNVILFLYLNGEKLVHEVDGLVMII